MKKFRSTHDYLSLRAHREAGGGVSLTVPDETMSIREILEKFSRGLDPGVTKTPVYSPDATFDSPDLQQLRDDDIVDREEYAMRLATSNAATEKALKASFAKAEAAQAAAKVAAEEKQKRIDRIIAKEDARSKDDDKK